MAGERDTPVGTVLRGEALQRALQAAGTPARASAPAPAPTPSPARGAGSTPRLINGVPASAAVHCCGRGCAHCRIYWRKNDV